MIWKFWSRAILKDSVLEENIEQVFSCYNIGSPAWHLYVKVLLSCSLTEDLLEFIYKCFVLNLKVIDDFVLVFNVSLKFSDLMLVAVNLVVLDALELLDLSLTSTLLTISLALHKSNILVFFSLPSCKIFLCFSSEIFLCVLKIGNLLVASLNLNLFKSDCFSELRDKRIFFSIFFLETFDFAFKLLCLEVVDLLNVFKFLNK